MSALDTAICVRSYPGSPRGGDVGCIIPDNNNGVLAALIDASGHGLSAYSVAQKCRSVIVDHPYLEPDDLLLLLDEACKNSIGAAASIVRIRDGHAIFAGIGNVLVQINGKHIVPKLGILGKRMRTPSLINIPFGKGSRLVMHSDGIARLPEQLPNGSAQTVASALVEKWGSIHDDASALIVDFPESL